MSHALSVYGDSVAVELKTRFVHCLVIPAQAIAHEDSSFSSQFETRYQHRFSQGYCEEDSTILALWDVSILRDNESASASEGLSPTPLRASDADRSVLSPGSARLFPTLVDLPARGDGDFAFARLCDPSPGIYPIVETLPMLAELLSAGVRIIQLRIKSSAITAEIRKTIREAIVMARRYPQSQLFINDYWKEAIEYGAFGVHLGQEDLVRADLKAIAKAGLRLGVSSHAFWEVARALTVSPSYVACGPVFPTRAKVMPWKPQGIANLRFWSLLIKHPVIGIGGINAENLADVRATGCAGASIIAAIVNAPSAALAYQQLQSLWENQRPEQNTHRAVELASPTLAQ